MKSNPINHFQLSPHHHSCSTTSSSPTSSSSTSSSSGDSNLIPWGNAGQAPEDRQVIESTEMSKQ
ncbi:hypothetical protein CRUP_010939 [Coryphaenoides rupestris]|nr:hypothetical protein CRUP_010939 [Coryphaenoides rupestris]